MNNFARIVVLLAATCLGCKRQPPTMPKIDPPVNIDELTELFPELRSDESVGHYTRVRAAHWLLERALAQGVTPKAQVRDAREAVLAWMSQEAGNAETAPIIWQSCAEFLATLQKHRMIDDQKRILDGCTKIPQLDPWLLQMIAGQYYLHLAWHYRGSETAQHVSADGWQKLGRFLPVAATHFQLAWQLRPELPQAAAAMISVSMAGGDPQSTPREWFDRALHAAMDWQPAYEAYTNALYPRWGGSNRERIALGQECAATRRYDTSVPYLLFRILNDTEVAPDGDPNIFQNPKTYAALEPMFRGYRESPDAQEVFKQAATANYGVVAARLGHFDDARSAFDQIDDETFRKNVASHEKYSMLRGLAYAATGPAAEQVRRLHEKNLTGVVVDAATVAEMKTWLAEARKLDKDSRSVRYFDELDKMLGWRERFLSGDWVELTFDERILGWKLVGAGAERTIENDKSVVLSTRKSGVGGMLVESLLPFEPPFVIEADMHQIAPAKLPTIGIHIGDSLRFNGQGRYFSISRPSSAAGRIVFGERDLGGYLRLKPVNRMRIKVWQGYWEESVNNAFFYPGVEPDFRTNGRVAVGDYMVPDLVGEARFSNVRVRALAYEKPPSDPEAVVDYYQQVVKSDPDDAMAQLYLASYLISMGKLDEAAESIERLEALIDKLDWNSSGLASVQGSWHFNKHQYRQAWDKFQQAMSDQRHKAAVQPYLAWLMAAGPDASMRDGEQAIRYATETLATPSEDRWWHHDALAAAYAETGDFARACELQQEAIDEAPADKQAAERERLQLYQAKTPYRLADAEDLSPTNEATK